MNKCALAVLIALLFLTFGCATQPLPTVIYPKAIYPISHYPMSAESNGLKVAAVPFTLGRDVYADPQAPVEKEAARGLDVLEAGVMPVRLIVMNRTGKEIVLDPDQIIGSAGEVAYRTYSPQEAVDLVTQSQAFQDAVKGSQVGPLVRSILGGEVIMGAVKGGVGGVAAGGITGGASGVAKGATGVGMERAQGYEKALTRLIAREYTGEAIQRQTLYPGFIADGLIFLPSGVGITELRVQAYEPESKKSIALNLKLP